MIAAAGRLVRRLGALVRASDWWLYKIPPLLAFAYAGCVLTGDVTTGRIAAIAVALAIICLVAAFGYALNDLCDIDEDLRAGRRNAMAGVGAPVRAAFVLLPAAGAVAIAASTRDPVLLALVAANLLLPVLYSVRPVRLKGRGILGVFADAGGVHMLPAATVAWAATAGATAAGDAHGLFLAAVMGNAWLAGVRGILVHQAADRASDAMSGVRTFGAVRGRDTMRRLVMLRVLPAEAIALAVLLGLVLPRAPVAAFILLVHAVIELGRVRRGWKLPVFDRTDDSREPYVPLASNELYEVWLPFAMGFQLAAMDVRWLVLPAIQVIAFLPNIRTRLLPSAGPSAKPVGEAAPDAFLPAEPPSRPQSPRPLPPSSPPPGPDPVPPSAAAEPIRVIVGATYWSVNGVNIFSANLVRELVARGVSAHVLLSEDDSDLIQIEEKLMAYPADVPFERLPVERSDGWGRHWGRMIRYLEERAPCIWIPNSDWRHSTVCPRLSDEVSVVGVVHSDDPLHYDHVRRLGATWDAVVCVSDAVARSTAEVCPDTAGRTTTIPIGVHIPEVLPRRRESRDRLRLIYHGALKRHQKRVLDLPRIVRAAEAVGVPVELSIAGAGPDEDVLRAQVTDLVDRGTVRFLGVVPPDAIGEVLDAHDVYVLPSEFEGMPNALLEAMGHGCVPIVTRMVSGVPEVVREGESGFLVPVGDADAFARRLKLLWEEPDRLDAMRQTAFETVSRGRFRLRDMVDAYEAVFAKVLDAAASGGFRRARGELCPPPATVGAESLFPVPLPHRVEEVGAFPSVEDAEDFEEEMNALAGPPPESETLGPRPPPLRKAEAVSDDDVSLGGMPVFVSAPVWTDNGVNLWSEDLVRGLRSVGVDARLLLTEESTGLVTIDEPRLARPADLPVVQLRPKGLDGWGARWGALVHLLEESSPCVYLPNYDWRHSCIAPILSDRVAVIGTLHDDGPLYAEHALRLSHAWNATLVTSRSLVRHMQRAVSDPGRRVELIPHGVELSALPVPKPEAGAMRTIVLFGANDHAALREIARMLASGPDGIDAFAVGAPEALWPSLRTAGVNVLVRATRGEWLQLCRSAHAVVAAPSDAEVERRLSEAMGHGCAPIIFAGAGHVAHAVLHEATGFVVVDGDTEAASAHARRLRLDTSLRETIGERARIAARSNRFRNDQMIDAFCDLLRRVRAGSASGAFRRPRGPLLPPPRRIEDTGILPVDLAFRTALGAFPSRRDADRFLEEAGRITWAPALANEFSRSEIGTARRWRRAEAAR